MLFFNNKIFSIYLKFIAVLLSFIIGIGINTIILNDFKLQSMHFLQFPKTFMHSSSLIIIRNKLSRITVHSSNINIQDEFYVSDYDYDISNSYLRIYFLDEKEIVYTNFNFSITVCDVQ